MAKEILTITVVRELPNDCAIPTPSEQNAAKDELVHLLRKILFPMAETVSASYEVSHG